MRRADFLKMLGITLLPWQEKIFNSGDIPDPLLEEFEEAGIEEEFQRRERAFWLDTMIQDAWEEGREARFALLDPKAWQETMIQAGVAAIGEVGLHRAFVYVSDFGDVRLLHAREWPWIELNEHGAWLLDELPEMHAPATVCFSGGPLNGRTSRASFMARLYEGGYWDGRRHRRATYVPDEERTDAHGNRLIIAVPA